MPSFNWPQKGDSAFKPTILPTDKLRLKAFIMPSEGAYFVGFRLAADSIIKAARNNVQNEYPDLLFFPIAYLYRHYLELILKSIVYHGVNVEKITNADNSLTSHDLCKLWNKAKKLIVAVWPDSNLDELSAVERVILEFHKLDKSGQALRYHKDKKGNPYLADAPDFVDLDSLKTTMNAVSNFLEAAETGIDAYDPGFL